MYEGYDQHAAVEIFRGRIRVSYDIGNYPVSTMFRYVDGEEGRRGREGRRGGRAGGEEGRWQGGGRGEAEGGSTLLWRFSEEESE